MVLSNRTPWPAQPTPARRRLANPAALVYRRAIMAGVGKKPYVGQTGEERRAYDHAMTALRRLLYFACWVVCLCDCSRPASPSSREGTVVDRSPATPDASVNRSSPHAPAPSEPTEEMHGMFSIEAFRLGTTLPVGWEARVGTRSGLTRVSGPEGSHIRAMIWFSPAALDAGARAVLFQARRAELVSSAPSGRHVMDLRSGTMETAIGTGWFKEWQLSETRLETSRVLLLPFCDGAATLLVQESWWTAEGRDALEAWHSTFKTSNPIESPACRSVVSRPAEKTGMSP